MALEMNTTLWTALVESRWTSGAPHWAVLLGWNGTYSWIKSKVTYRGDLNLQPVKKSAKSDLHSQLLSYIHRGSI